MGRKTERDEFNEKLARLASEFEEFTDWFDRAADAAMLEPGCPQLPEPQIPAQRAPELPRDIMGGQGA